jgi:hypothetical protein
MIKPAAWLNKPFKFVTSDDPSEFVENLNQWEPLYPKREWVGLTDEEITELFCDYESSQFPKLARAIEAKLKEKNHA